jgi:hypothetical protein
MPESVVAAVSFAFSRRKTTMKTAVAALTMLLAVAEVAPVAWAQVDVTGMWVGKGSCKGLDGSTGGGEPIKSTETMVELHFDNQGTGLAPGGHFISAASDSDTYPGFVWAAVVVASTKSGNGLIYLSQRLTGPCRDYGYATGYLKLTGNSKLKGTLTYGLNVPFAACKVSLSFVPGSAAGEPATYCN